MSLKCRPCRGRQESVMLETHRRLEFGSWTNLNAPAVCAYNHCYPGRLGQKDCGIARACPKIPPLPFSLRGGESISNSCTLWQISREFFRLFWHLIIPPTSAIPLFLHSGEGKLIFRLCNHGLLCMRRHGMLFSTGSSYQDTISFEQPVLSLLFWNFRSCYW